MGDVIGPAIIGIILIVIGYFNTKGNINSLHWYHRKRVSEEDRIPFGKKVGLGTILIGIAVETFAACSLAALLLDNDIFTLIGTVIVVIGIIVGCFIMFSAMIKYNKGIF